MKTFLKLLLLCIALNTYGQEGIKFEVENLSKPKLLLVNKEYNEIYRSLILSDAGMLSYDLLKDSNNLPFNIIAKSDAPDSLVNYGYHSFFYGMYNAYSDHRPFVISPDMIWLLICQGFARHINANSEELRHKIVDFDGKLTLIVNSNSIKLDSPSSSWESIFPEFTKQISQHTLNNIVDILASDFSTTTPTEKVASEITIMEAFKSYFEFIVFYIGCGIPEITLKGTSEDWQKILDRTIKLGEYDLEWWTKEIKPILKEFVKTSEGDINKKFWRKMFKVHSTEEYGAPNIIDGWIVKFYPYDKDGKRNNLKELVGDRNLPDEIVKVDLKYIEINDNTAKTTPLELWAGFVGLEQNPVDFTLYPKIGWMIRKKNDENFGLLQKLEADNKSSWGGISIRVKEIPEEIYELKEIKNLEISFIDKIIIPDRMMYLKIDRLVLTGEIDKYEIERISKMFPNTKLSINRTIINSQ